MDSKIHPVLYYFSLFYFVYVIITDFLFISRNPSLWILVAIGIVSFVYAYKYVKK